MIRWFRRGRLHHRLPSFVPPGRRTTQDQVLPSREARDLQVRLRAILVRYRGGQSETAVRTMAAYIDLNPVRAGIVKDAKDYHWSGYGQAMAGNRSTRDGLTRLVRAETGDDGGTERWPQAQAIYRCWLYEDGRELRDEHGRVVRRGIPSEIVVRVLEREEGRLAFPVLATTRLRHLSQGLAIGSAQFIETVFAASRDAFIPAPPGSPGYAAHDSVSLSRWVVRPGGSTAPARSGACPGPLARAPGLARFVIARRDTAHPDTRTRSRGRTGLEPPVPSNTGLTAALDPKSAQHVRPLRGLPCHLGRFVGLISRRLQEMLHVMSVTLTISAEIPRPQSSSPPPSRTTRIRLDPVQRGSFIRERVKTRSASAPESPTSNHTDTRPIQHAADRLTQRTVKFIRWLKNHLDLERDWGQAIVRLNQVYTNL